jgi:FHS family L-fucose permease-like MFS transporter
MSDKVQNRVGDVSPADPSSKSLTILVMSLFFSFGFCTVLVDTLIPKLKSLFLLNYTEVMLTQFCFFGAYFIFSLPAARMVAKLGYLKSITLGLVIMAVGCLAFTPAADMGNYAFFLLALFILACGVTMVQVGVNPLATSIGNPKTAHSRLTLAQAFNSLATTIGPIFGAIFILSGQAKSIDLSSLTDLELMKFRQIESHSIQTPFIVIASVLVCLSLICWYFRKSTPPIDLDLNSNSDVDFFNNKKLVFGAVCIFLYVGAEVSIGSALANYLIQPTILALDIRSAGYMVSYYWGLAMCGRFIGFLLLKKFKPEVVLTAFAVCAIALAFLSMMTYGAFSGYALIFVGFFNSIMFPTIFSLAIDDLNQNAPKASGYLCLAIVGGAIIPMLFGMVADAKNLQSALVIPILCYMVIAIFGKYNFKSIEV